MDSLLLGLLLGSQKSSVSDEDYRDIFRDREIKAAALRTIVFLSITAFVFSVLTFIFEKHIFLYLLFLVPAGVSCLMLPFCLYYYLKCVIVQWLKF